MTSATTLIENPAKTLGSTPLIAADRCDRCGAAAKTRSILKSGGELLFCGHHTDELGPNLIKDGATLYDQRVSAV